MSCARSVSSRDSTSFVRTHFVAPISCATLTSDGYSRQPVSSFTSTTNALISVESASRTSCASLLDPNAHALTYSALIGSAWELSNIGSGRTYRSSMPRNRIVSGDDGSCWAKRPRLAIAAQKKNAPACRANFIGATNIGNQPPIGQALASHQGRKLLNSNG